MKNFIDLKTGDTVYVVYDRVMIKPHETDMILASATIMENIEDDNRHKISIYVKELDYTYVRWYDAVNHKKHSDKYKYKYYGLHVSSVPIDYMPALFVFIDKDEAKCYLIEHCTKRIEVLSNHMKQYQNEIEQLKHSLHEYGE